jgi:hypothetical protein
MRGAADHLRRFRNQRIGRWQAGFEHAQPQLHAQDPAYRIIDAAHGNDAGLHLGQRVDVQPFPGIRRLQHVQPGVIGHRAILVGAAGHLAVRVPVAEHDAAEVHAALQHIGDQRLVAGHLHAVPAGERHHHHLHAGLDRGRITSCVHVAQRHFAQLGIALVLAVAGAAVAHEMLGGGDHVVGIQIARRAEFALEAFDHRGGVLRHQCGILRVTLIRAAPASILRHRERGREGPVDAAGAQLLRGDFANRADEFRIARIAQRGVLREQGAADQVVVPMHRIDAEQHRDRRASGRGIHRGPVERIGQLLPLLRRTVLPAIRARVAAGQDRSKAIFAHVIGCHRLDVGLDHLADLVLRCHRRQQRVDPCFQRGVRWQRPVTLRPQLGMDGGGVGSRGRVNGHKQRASE